MNFINLENLKSVTWEPPKYSLITLLGVGYGTIIFADGTKDRKLRGIENVEEIVKMIKEIRESLIKKQN